MKIFSIILVMVFALSLNASSAVADSKSGDRRSSDSRSKDDRSGDSRSKDDRSSADNEQRRFQRNAVDARDVRESGRNDGAQRTFPDWWPFY